jgi:hypothetical protein
VQLTGTSSEDPAAIRIEVLRMRFCFRTLELLAVEKQDVLRGFVDDPQAGHRAALADFGDLETVEGQRLDQGQVGRFGRQSANTGHRPRPLWIFGSPVRRLASRVLIAGWRPVAGIWGLQTCPNPTKGGGTNVGAGFEKVDFFCSNGQ